MRRSRYWQNTKKKSLSLVNLYADSIDRPVWAHIYFLVDFKDETFSQSQGAGESTVLVTSFSFPQGEYIEAPITASTCKT